MADGHASQQRSGYGRWTPERIARLLVPERDRLVAQLPREIAAARDLTVDQRELVIDDAIDYMVTQYAKPLVTRDDLDRAFWAAASFRVKRAHEGRGATVRARFRRASADDLETVAASDDPEARVIERDERLTLLEFVATLSPSERRVFACKYGSGARVAGRNQVSRWLGLPIGEVRKAERNIARKLERFITLVSAGALCSFRSPALDALAASGATGDEMTAARLHLKRCPACQRAYAERVRALRSGQLPRDIAALLPLPIQVASGDERPTRAIVLDWISRPFGGEPAAAATQLASTGAGRGVGTVAALKLASLCVAGAAMTGGICVSLQQSDGDRRPHRAPDRAEAQPAPTRDNEALLRRPKRPLTPAPAPTPQPDKPRERRAAEQRAHETDAAVSPPAEGAQPGGVDEFGPSNTTVTTTPAAPPPTGGPEFP